MFNKVQKLINTAITLTLLIYVSLNSSFMFAKTIEADVQQQWLGDWQGEINISEKQKIALIFHINKNNQNYQASVDVPAQQQFGLPFNKITINNNEINLLLDIAKIKYQGKLTIDAGKKTIIGTYSQGSFSAPLNLQVTNQVITRVKKPQEPNESISKLPYTIEQVQFNHPTLGHSLSGTLTLPKENITKVAILLSGSGPTTRDEDVAGHKIFLVLADKLSRQGIAVLRYDDRGVGKSTGNFNLATSADFASDANAAFQFIKADSRFQQSKIGFIGHSEGGLIGAISASQNPDVGFFISLAGPGTSGEQILIDQSLRIQKLMGVPEKTLQKDHQLQKTLIRAIKQGISSNELSDLMMANGITEKQAKAQASQMTSPWFKYFIKTDAKTFLAKLKLPVLALNGGLDAQVLAKENIAGIQQAIPLKYLTTRVYPKLNHLFQPAITGLPQEYSKSEITFSQQVIDDMVRWLNKL